MASLEVEKVFALRAAGQGCRCRLRSSVQGCAHAGVVSCEEQEALEGRVGCRHPASVWADRQDLQAMGRECMEGEWDHWAASIAAEPCTAAPQNEHLKSSFCKQPESKLWINKHSQMDTAAFWTSASLIDAIRAQPLCQNWRHRPFAKAMPSTASCSATRAEQTNQDSHCEQEPGPAVQ